tara:strand:- start:825 stop:1058 length:234 start_codon:yes stop_codon:yes gene_type:complete
MMDVSKLNDLHSSFFREMQEVLDKFCDLEGLDKGESASDMLNQELTDYQLEFINAFIQAWDGMEEIGRFIWKQERQL